MVNKSFFFFSVEISFYNCILCQALGHEGLTALPAGTRGLALVLMGITNRGGGGV